MGVGCAEVIMQKWGENFESVSPKASVLKGNKDRFLLIIFFFRFRESWIMEQHFRIVFVFFRFLFVWYHCNFCIDQFSVGLSMSTTFKVLDEKYTILTVLPYVGVRYSKFQWFLTYNFIGKMLFFFVLNISWGACSGFYFLNQVILW